MNEVDRDLSGLAELLGHTFNHADILRRAVTHASAEPRAWNAYERLEFLGDRVLGLIMAEWLWELFPKETEGSLSKRLNALVTGAVAIRTSGVNFIMITLAFGQMAFFTASSLSGYGGDDGYTLYARTEVNGARLLDDRLVFHFVCLGALVFTWLLCRMLLASRFGRVLRAVRGNPMRAQALGFSPYPYRLTAYVIAGALSGAAGFLFANATEFVAPAYISWQRSGELLFMVILGGLSGLHGALLGAVGFVLLEEWLSHQWEHWRIAFGVLLILAVLFLPGGLSGIPAQVGRMLRRD